MEDKVSILIVEDVKVWQSIYEKALMPQGYRIEIAGSYSEAKNILDRKSFDIAITEICLNNADSSNIDGMKVIEEIRNSGKKTRIIIVTAYGTLELAREASQKYAVYDFIEKHTVNIAELRRLVGQANPRSIASKSTSYISSQTAKSDENINNKLTVFVCGTYRDLIEERKEVLEAIRRLQHKHDSMEYFGARPNRPIETCLDEVRKSDVLIVIVGHTYGSIVPDLKVSYSEAEYREGLRLGKQCLVYLRTDDVPILPKFMEDDPKKMKLLKQFKNSLNSRHTVATFRDVHDLSLSVTADLSRITQNIETAKADPMQLTDILEDSSSQGFLDLVRTLSSKIVLILGRFDTAGRRPILDALKTALRAFDLVPVSFDFDRPTDRDFTETIRVLAGLSYFVIADITNPKSSPLELQATVPDYQIPFVPIIQEGEHPFAMMVDLQKKYDWVLDPISYDSKETLIRILKPLIIDSAIKKHNELRLIKS